MSITKWFDCTGFVWFEDGELPCEFSGPVDLQRRVVGDEVLDEYVGWCPRCETELSYTYFDDRDRTERD